MPDRLESLEAQPLVVWGTFPDASNTALLAETADGLRCVYKPDAGERPLWDFPRGTLGARERATRWDEGQLRAEILALRQQGQGASQIGRQLAARSGWPRREIYRLAVKTGQSGASPDSRR